MVRRDPHTVLGLAPGASASAIKAAWRRLAREHHPDLAGSTAERRTATRRMAEINAAYADLRSRAASAPGRRHGGSGAPGEPPDDAQEGGRGRRDPPLGPPATAAHAARDGALRHQRSASPPQCDDDASRRRVSPPSAGSAAPAGMCRDAGAAPRVRSDRPPGAAAHAACAPPTAADAGGGAGPDDHLREVPRPDARGDRGCRAVLRELAGQGDHPGPRSPRCRAGGRRRAAAGHGGLTNRPGQHRGAPAPDAPLRSRDGWSGGMSTTGR